MGLVFALVVVIALLNALVSCAAATTTSSSSSSSSRHALFANLLSDSVRSEELILESRQWLRSAAKHSSTETSSLLAKLNSRATRVIRGLSVKVDGDIGAKDRPNIHHDPSKGFDVANSNERVAFLMKLSAACDSDAFSAMTGTFTRVDPNFAFQWTGRGTVLITSTMASLIDATSAHSKSIAGLIPYVSDYKIEQHLYESLHHQLTTSSLTQDGSKRELADYVSEKDCKMYVAQVTSMSSEELANFRSRLIELGSEPSLRFATNFEGSSAGRAFNIIVQVSPSKASRASGEVYYSCDARLDQSIVDLLADMPEVMYIDAWTNPVVSNRWSKGLCQSGVQSETPLYGIGYQINGTGQIVGVSDTGIDVKNCYFYDPDNKAPRGSTVNHAHRKIVKYDKSSGADYFDDNLEGHGTHVAGSVAGESILNYGDFKKYNGVAWGAKLAFFDLGNEQGELKLPGNVGSQLMQSLYDAGARIITNSWVNENVNYYSSLSKDVDDFMYTHPDALVIFSAGNQGDDGSNTVWAPGTFKNGMTVGAASNDNKVWQGLTLGQAVGDFKYSSMMTFSSQGPTEDGRMKPDIAAPGSFIISAHAFFNASEMHCDIMEMQGTSMAAPTSAGATALMREYFTRGFYPKGVATKSDSFSPSGALMKAMMIASSSRMDRVVASKGDGTTSVNEILTAYPNNIQGYGHISLNNVLNFDRDCMLDPLTLFVQGAANKTNPNYVSIMSGQTNTKTFKPDVGATSVRVVLTYTDIPTTAHTSINQNFGVVLNKISVKVTTIDDNGITKTFDPYIASTVQDNVFVIDIFGEDVIAGRDYTVSVTADANLQYTLPYNSGTGLPYALVIRGNNQMANSSSISNDDASDLLSNLKSLTKTQLTPGMLKTVVGMSVVALILLGMMLSIKFAIKDVLIQRHKAAVLEGDPSERDALNLVQQQQIEIQAREYEEQQRKAYIAIQQEYARKKGGGGQRSTTAPSTPNASSPSTNR